MQRLLFFNNWYIGNHREQKKMLDPIRSKRSKPNRAYEENCTSNL